LGHIADVFEFIRTNHIRTTQVDLLIFIHAGPPEKSTFLDCSGQRIGPVRMANLKFTKYILCGNKTNFFTYKQSNALPLFHSSLRRRWHISAVSVRKQNTFSIVFRFSCKHKHKLIYTSLHEAEERCDVASSDAEISIAKMVTFHALFNTNDCFFWFIMSH
jgi:hypothetical protein